MYMNVDSLILNIIVQNDCHSSEINIHYYYYYYYYYCYYYYYNIAICYLLMHFVRH